MTDSFRIVKNTGVLYLKTVISMFVMLYVTRVVLKSLGSEDYGIYNVVGGIISMFGFVYISMATTIQRFFNNAQGKDDLELQKTHFNIAIVYHVIIGIAVVFLLFAIQFLFFDFILNISELRHHAAVYVYQCMIASTFFSIIAVPYDALINSHEDMVVYSVIGIFDVILKLLIAIIVSYSSGDKLIIYSLLMIAVPILNYLLMRIYSYKCYKECRINVYKYYDRGKAREVLKFAGWNFVGLSTSMVGNYGVGIILNHFFGALLNAANGIATQLQGMLSVLSSQFLKALNPVIFKLGGCGDKSKMVMYSYVGCKYSFILFFFLSAPVIIETPYILHLWLGNYPDWAVMFVRLVLVRALLEQITYSLNRSLEAVGTIKQYNQMISIFNITPLLILYLIYKMGGQPYWNVVVPLIFMSLIPSFIKIYYCRLYCSMDYISFSRSVIIPCVFITVLSMAAGHIPLLFMVEGWMRLSCCSFLSWVVIGIVFMTTLSQSEQSLFRYLYHLSRKRN